MADAGLEEDLEGKEEQHLNDEGYLDEYGDEYGHMEDDIDDSPYHELYLQKHGMEFMMPILFEDGMDFIECELYYASLTSQNSGGAFRKQKNIGKKSTSRELRFENDNGILPCIRKNPIHRADPPNTVEDSNNDKNQNQNSTSAPEATTPPPRGPGPKKSAPPIRRCSFSGMPQVDDFVPLTRSVSMQGLGDEDARVCFDEYVQVVTIYPAEEYPEEVKSQIWMSRDEMSKCMRRAMLEDMKERDRERDQRDKRTEKDGERGDDDTLYRGEDHQVVELEAH